MKNPNVFLGLSFVSAGVAVAVALDPWWIGMAFLLAGAHRLYLGLLRADNAVED